MRFYRSCLSDATLNRNGVGSYYSDLIDYLNDTLDRAELICPGSNGGAHILCKTALPGDPTQKLYWPHVGRLLARIRAADPDVIISATPGPYGLVGYAAAKLWGYGLCVGYHTAYEKLTDMYWRQPMSSISRLYMKVLNRMLFSASDVVIANSDEMNRRARSDGARTVLTIGTPIAKAFLKRHTQLIASPPRSLCYCGRLTLEKNIPEILATAKKMPAKRFTFAGDGPLRSAVAQAAVQHDNIRYLGWVSRDAVRSIIDEADIMLLPSVVEAFGTIALEATSRQRLVLVTEGCGIVNWPALSSGVYVMKAGESLCQAIERICSGDHENHHKKVRFAYRAAHAFNVLTIKQWTSVFQQVRPAPAPC